jgi:hypothetical protein
VDNPIKGLPPKQKKALVVVGVGAAAYIAWKWYSSSGDSEPITVTSGTDDDSAGTGVIGSNVGGSENVGNSSNITDEISSNNKWYAEAVDRMTNAGWNAQVVQSALGEFLTGQSLDDEEARIVRAAVGAMGGYPPQGPNSITVTPGITDASKLAAPSGLKVVSKDSDSVTLSWGAVTGAKDYRIYRSGVAANVGHSVDTKVTIGGLEANRSYTFYVAAGLGGGKMGKRSSGVTAKTTSRKLSKVTGVKVSQIGKTSARLTWSYTYPGEYLVRRSGSSQTWESVDTAMTLTGLKPRTKYSYQVAAVNPGTRTPGTWSSYATFTTKR